MRKNIAFAHCLIAALAIVGMGMSHPAAAFTFPESITVSRDKTTLHNTTPNLGGSTCGNSCDGKVCVFYAIPSADPYYSTFEKQMEHAPEATSATYFSESHAAFLGHTGTAWTNATAEMGKECYYFTGFDAGSPVCHMNCYDENANRSYNFYTNKNRENSLTEAEEQKIVYDNTVALAKKIMPILTCPAASVDIVPPTTPASDDTLKKTGTPTAPAVKMTAKEKNAALKKASTDYNAAIKAATAAYNAAIKAANANFKSAIKDTANNDILKAAKAEYDKISKEMNADMAAARKTGIATLIAGAKKNDMPILNAAKKTYLEAQKTYKTNHGLIVKEATTTLNAAKKFALQTFQAAKADALTKYKAAKALIK